MLDFKYKFKFYVNATHAVTINNQKSQIHPHTWEIVSIISVNKNKFVNFSNFENILEKYFKKFEGKYLNELSEFSTIEPTMENMAYCFYSELNTILSQKKLELESIEISENPTRTYIISRKDLLSND
ncbi:MAG: 6-carboxytetrahydropterin synthase [Sarcina sp.]